MKSTPNNSTRLFIVWAACVFFLPGFIEANSNSEKTNAIVRGVVPWDEAIRWIETSVPKREKASAVSGLGQYSDKRSIPYLKKYSNDPDDVVRVATFWPLYRLREKQYAFNLLRRELSRNNKHVAWVFPMPNSSPRPIEIFNRIKNDTELRIITRQTALNRSVTPWIRIHAAISLSQVGDGQMASTAANDILSSVPEPKNDRDFTKLTSQEQDNWHTRYLAKWCLEIISGKWKPKA